MLSDSTPPLLQYYVVQLLPDAPRGPDSQLCVALESGPHRDLVTARNQVSHYKGVGCKLPHVKHVHQTLCCQTVVGNAALPECC